jgi:DNA uptake protein ComE-like DNA-binding protein
MPRTARGAVEMLLITAGVVAGVLFQFSGASEAPAPKFSDQVVQVVPARPAEVHDDDPNFNCATAGNHVCGPGNTEGLAAGCYDDGTLVVPWSQLDDPQADTSPCAGQAPTQQEESDKAYAAAQTGTVRTVASVSAPRPAAGSCSEPLPVPPVGTPAPAPAPAPQSRPLVNVNTASVAQLEALPGIGTVLAARIVAQRPFSSVADLHRVARIPAKVFPLVTV